jgi:hypothetical protein
MATHQAPLNNSYDRRMARNAGVAQDKPLGRKSSLESGVQ